MQRIATILAAAMLATVLAGCSEDAPPAKGDELPDGKPLAFEDAGTSETTGGITGVIVDQAVVPAAGVNVILVGQGKNVTTGPGGTFSFSNLEPGFYVIQANGTGYFQTQSSAEVTAGEVTKIKMIIPNDLTPPPYHSTLKFDWFDSAGVVLVDFIIDLTSDTFLGGAVPPQCDECAFKFETEGPVETFIVEAVWTDQIAPPSGDSSYFWTLADGNAWTNGYEDGYFTSPGLARVDDNRWGTLEYMEIKMTGDELWITVDQEAELYITMWYGAAAPEGWSFVESAG